MKPPIKARGIRFMHLTACLIATLLNAFLFAYFNFSIPFLGSKLILRPAFIFLIPFALWFGIWGAISGYLGFFFGMTMFGIGSFGLNIFWSIQALFLASIPLLAFRRLGGNPELNTRRDWLIFLISGWLIGNMLSSIWGALVPALFGLWPWMMVSDIWIDWLAGNLLLIGTITPLILNIFTKDVKELGAYTHGIIT